MSFRYEVNRCTIPAAVHGLSPTAQVRGACFSNGDLYLVVEDGGLYTWRVQLSDKPDLYLVEPQDILTWTPPWSIDPSLPVEDTRRVVQGLYIFSGYAVIFYPVSRSGETVLACAVASMGGSRESVDNLVVDTSSPLPGAQVVRIPYRAFQYAVPLGVGADLVLDFALAYGLGYNSTLRKNTYSQEVGYYLPDYSYYVQLGYDYSPVVGCTRLDSTRFAAFSPGDAGQALDVRQAPNGWDIGVSVDWSSPATLDFALTADWDEPHNEYFYAIYFDSSNDLYVDTYRDHVHQKSSARSTVSMSKTHVFYGDSSPVKVDVEFVDYFGYPLPDSSPVVVEVEDQGLLTTQEFKVNDLDIIDLQSSGYAGWVNHYSSLWFSAANWSSLSPLPYDGAAFEAVFDAAGTPSGTTKLWFWRDPSTGYGWYVGIDGTGLFSLHKVWYNSGTGQVEDVEYGSGGQLSSTPSNLRLVVNHPDAWLFWNGTLIAHASTYNSTRSTDFLVEGTDYTGTVNVYDPSVLTPAVQRHVYPFETGVSGLTHPQDVRLEFRNLTYTAMQEIVDFYKVDDQKKFVIRVNPDDGEVQNIVEIRFYTGGSNFGIVWVSNVPQPSDLGVAVYQEAGRYYLDLFVDGDLRIHTDISWVFGFYGPFGSGLLVPVTSTADSDALEVYDLYPYYNLPSDFSSPTLTRVFDSDFSTGTSGWFVNDPSMVVVLMDGSLVFTDPDGDDPDLPEIVLANPVSWQLEYAVCANVTLSGGLDRISIEFFDADTSTVLASFTVDGTDILFTPPGTRLTSVASDATVELLMIVRGTYMAAYVDGRLMAVQEVPDLATLTNARVRVKRLENLPDTVFPSVALSRLESGPYFDSNGAPLHTTLELTTEENKATFYVLPPSSGDITYVSRLRVVAGYPASDVPGDVVGQPVQVEKVYDLLSGEVVTGQIANPDEWLQYRVDVQGGSSELDVVVFDLSGDVAVYGKQGAPATPTDNDFDVTGAPDIDRWWIVDNPTPGYWYFTLYPWEKSRFSLKIATFSELPPWHVLENGVDVQGLSLLDRLKQYAKYQVSAADSVRLDFHVFSSKNELRAFLKSLGTPTELDYDQMGYVPEGGEVVFTVLRPAQGEHNLLFYPPESGRISTDFSVVVYEELPYVLPNGVYFDHLPEYSETYFKLPVGHDAREWLVELDVSSPATAYLRFDALPSETEYDFQITDPQGSFGRDRGAHYTPDFTATNLYVLVKPAQGLPLIRVRGTYCGNETVQTLNLGDVASIPICVGGEHRYEVVTQSSSALLFEASQAVGAGVLLYGGTSAPTKTSYLARTLPFDQVPDTLSGYVVEQMVVENPDPQASYFAYYASPEVGENITVQVDSITPVDDTYLLSADSGMVANMTLDPASWRYVEVEIPVSAVSLTINVEAQTSGTCWLYTRIGSKPTLSEYDGSWEVSPSAISVEIQSPQPGTWYIAVYNSTVNPEAGVSLSFRVDSELGMTGMP